jgi:hypothetical protein
MTTNPQTQEQMDQAKDTMRRAMESEKDAARNLGSQTADAFRSVAHDDNPTEGFVAIWEKVPTNMYFMAAAGSVLISLVLMLSGKQRAALFVGQWPPTMIALALMNKLLHPSREVRGDNR